MELQREKPKVKRKEPKAKPVKESVIEEEKKEDVEVPQTKEVEQEDLKLPVQTVVQPSSAVTNCDNAEGFLKEKEGIMKLMTATKTSSKEDLVNQTEALYPSMSQITMQITDVKVQEVPILKINPKALQQEIIIEDPIEMEPFRAKVIELDVAKYWESDPTLQDSIFYKLLCTYRDAQHALDNLKLDITVAKKNFDVLFDEVWKIETLTAAKYGTCKDGTKVQDTLQYQVARFQVEHVINLKNHMEANRVLTHENLISFLYQMKIARLHIESYLEEFLNSEFFMSLNPNGHAVAHDRSPYNVTNQQEIAHLKHLIHVLFHFEQHHSIEFRAHSISEGNAHLSTFYADVRSWLSHLCSILLRCASKNDHLFLMSHFVKCPDISKWGAVYVQFPPLCKDIIFAIQLLCVLLKPISSVHNVHMPTQEGNPPKTLDEHLLKEDDFVAIYEQFPFGMLFRYLFEETEGTEAFRMANYMVELLSTALTAFSIYTHFLKQLSQTAIILLTNASNSLGSSGTRAAFLNPLSQAHYDHLFMKVLRVFLAQNSIVWQFLAVMPFGFISQETAWNVLCIILSSGTVSPNIRTASDWFALTSSDQSILQGFYKTIQESSKALFVVHALTKLAVAWNNEIGRVVVSELYKISCVLPQTVASFYKSGREQLETICIAHPHYISYLLQLSKGDVSTLGKNVLQLFRVLPLKVWKPSLDDSSFLRELLLQPTDSISFKLAQHIFDTLNWSENVSSQLYLGEAFHNRAAIVVIEAYTHHTSKSGSYWVSSKVTDFITWCWKMLLHITHYYSNGTDRAKPLDLTDPNINAFKTQNFNPASTHFSESVDPFLAFASLELTVLGEQFMEKQYQPLLKSIIINRHHIALLRIMSDLLPVAQRYNRPIREDSLMMCLMAILRDEVPTSGSFLSLFKSIGPLFKPSTNGPNENVTWLRALVINHILQDDCSTFFIPSLTFWLNTLLRIPDWHTDRSCCLMVNDILKGSLSMGVGSEIQQILSSQAYKLFDKKVLKPQFFLMMKDYTALLFELLYTETISEKLARSKLADIIVKRPGTIDSIRGLDKPLDDFVIYRWLQCAVELDPLEPLLPLFWQMFFRLYFDKYNGVFYGYQFFMRRTRISLQQAVSRLDFLCNHMQSILEREKSMNHNTTYAALANQLLYLYSNMNGWLKDCQDFNKFIQTILPTKPQISSLTETTILDDRQSSGFWLECIDVHQVNEPLIHLKKSWKKFGSNMIELGTQRGSVRHSLRNSLPSDAQSMVVATTRSIQMKDEQIKPPPLFVIPPLTIQPYSVSASNSHLFEQLANDLTILIECANEYELQLTSHTSLDSHLLELLPLLYTNQPSTVTQAKACNRRECAGPAYITFDVEEKKASQESFDMLNSNRNELAFLLEHVDVSVSLCASLLRIRKTIDAMGSVLASNADISHLQKVGVKLFYRFVELNTPATIQFPPTSAFVAVLIGTLGNWFIAQNPSQTVPLLEVILPQPTLRVHLLAPYFFPATDAIHMVQMYKMVIQAHAVNQPNVLLPLLEKFKFEAWLHTSPSFDQCEAFLNYIGDVLSQRFIQDPNISEAQPYYLDTFRTVALHYFPRNFKTVLQIVLNGSLSKALPVEMWWIMLQLPLVHSLSQQDLLYAADSVADTLWRARQDAEGTGQTLYSTWTPYIPAIIHLTNVIIRSPQVLPQTASTQFLSTLGAPLAWTCLTKFYVPWISPVSHDVSVSNWNKIPVWFPHQISEASTIISALVEQITFLQGSFSTVIGGFWSLLYSTFGSTLMYMPPHVQQILHLYLVRLDWESWCINAESLSQITTMMQAAMNADATDFFALLKDIMLRINWKKADTSHGVCDYHLRVLQLFCFSLLLHPIPIDPSFIAWIENIVTTFDWSTITSSALEDFLGSPSWRALFTSKARNSGILSTVQSDKIVVASPPQHSYLNLAPTSPKAVVVNIEDKINFIFNVINAASGFEELKTVDFGNNNKLEPLIEKLHTYIKFVVFVLNNSSSITSITIHKSILARLCEHLNVLFRHDPDVFVRNRGLLIDLLEMFNAAKVPITVLSELLPRYSAMVPDLIYASCSTIASINKLATFVEVCIECHFLISANWKVIISNLQVPELSEGEYLKFCAESNLILTLYCYSIKRLSMDTSAETRLHTIDLLLHWNKDINLSKIVGKEHKMILLWFKTFELLWNHLKANPHDKTRSQQLHELAQGLLKYGEDKKTTGFLILSVIGLGEKSPFSLQFRLCCRLFGSFVLSQIKENTITVRLTATYEPFVLPKQVTNLLTATLKNSDYAPFSATLQTAQTFISDPTKTLDQLSTYLFMLTSRLYPDCKYFINLM